MAKKKKFVNSFVNYSRYALLLFTIATIVMCFVSNVAYTLAGSTTGINGFNVMFGWSVSKEVLGSTITTTYSTFSIMGVLAYALPIAGLILALLSAKNNTLFNVISLACFAISAVLMFLMPNFLVLNDVGKDFLASIGSFTLSAGAIIAGVLSILNTLVIGAKLFLALKNK